MMKKLYRSIRAALLTVFALLSVYIITALVMTYWTVVPDRSAHVGAGHTIYLRTNGVHLDVMLAARDLEPGLRSHLVNADDARYLSFGWGDEQFYLYTPDWSDLDVGTAVQAAFLPSPTLMHVTSCAGPGSRDLKVEVDSAQLAAWNRYLLQSFATDSTGSAIHLSGSGYGSRDEFYRAQGSYSCLHTCNSWVNSGLAYSEMPHCAWTPFDFGVMGIYAEEE